LFPLSNGQDIWLKPENYVYIYRILGGGWIGEDIFFAVITYFRKQKENERQESGLRVCCGGLFGVPIFLRY
jgi:hypothetical protein